MSIRPSRSQASASLHCSRGVRCLHMEQFPCSRVRAVRFTMACWAGWNGAFQQDYRFLLPTHSATPATTQRAATSRKMPEIYRPTEEIRTLTPDIVWQLVMSTNSHLGEAGLSE